MVRVQEQASVLSSPPPSLSHDGDGEGTNVRSAEGFANLVLAAGTSYKHPLLSRTALAVVAGSTPDTHGKLSILPDDPRSMRSDASAMMRLSVGGSSFPPLSSICTKSIVCVSRHTSESFSLHGAMDATSQVK